MYDSVPSDTAATTLTGSAESDESPLSRCFKRERWRAVSCSMLGSSVGS